MKLFYSLGRKLPVRGIGFFRISHEKDQVMAFDLSLLDL